MAITLSLSRIPLNWKKVSKQLIELSDSSKLELIVNQRMEAIIKKQHPNDYEEFARTHKEQLSVLKDQMTEKTQAREKNFSLASLKA